MKRRFRISTLALAGFVVQDPALAATTGPEPGANSADLERLPLIEAFRAEHAFTLAGHRSHSSHSSHRSSSGGGGGHSSHSSHRSSATAPTPRTYPAPSSRNSNSTPPSNVLPSSPATAPKSLRGGSEKFREIVRKVQIALAARGYYHGSIDGLVGPETRAALVRFQGDSSLEITGTITQETLDALAITAR